MADRDPRAWREHEIAGWLQKRIDPALPPSSTVWRGFNTRGFEEWGLSHGLTLSLVDPTTRERRVYQILVREVEEGEEENG